MSDLVLDSRGREDVWLSLRNSPPTTSSDTWSNPPASLTQVEDEMHDGVVSCESVEGLPLALVQRYAEVAARHAHTREVDPGVWVATVAGLDGAWGDGKSPEAAADSLREAIVGWVAVKLRVGATDIPPIEGFDLNPRQ